MSPYSLEDIAKLTDRHKLYILQCRPETLAQYISSLRDKGVPTVNMGKEIATFIGKPETYNNLNIDIQDFITWVLDHNRAKDDGTSAKAVAVYNIGVMLEPDLGLKATLLLKEYSKSAGLIILWDNQFDQSARLFWETQTTNYFFDFTDTPLKQLHYAI